MSSVCVFIISFDRKISDCCFRVVRCDIDTMIELGISWYKCSWHFIFPRFDCSLVVFSGTWKYVCFSNSVIISKLFYFPTEDLIRLVLHFGYHADRYLWLLVSWEHGFSCPSDERSSRKRYSSKVYIRTRVWSLHMHRLHHIWVVGYIMMEMASNKKCVLVW